VDPRRQELYEESFGQPASGRLILEVNGSDGGVYENKPVAVNHCVIGPLPAAGDWAEAALELTPDALATLSEENEVLIANSDPPDAFKVRRARIEIVNAEGKRFVTATDEGAYTSVGWEFAEGQVGSPIQITLRFGPPEEEKKVMLKRIVFLVHPHCYAAISPDGQDEKTRPYWERERKVEVQWKQGIDTLGEEEFLALFSTHASNPAHPVGVLAQYAQERLGPRFLALTAGGNFDDASFRAWTDTLKAALKERGFAYDPAAVRCEGWGESFDGCVAGFSAFLSGTLQLATPVEALFDLTVPDMPFLVNARLVERVRLPEKQLRLFLFEDSQRRPLGLFMPEVCRDGLKAYKIAVPADPATLHVYTKQGKRVELVEDTTPVVGSLAGGLVGSYPTSQPANQQTSASQPANQQTSKPPPDARQTEDGIVISLRRDAPHPFFGGQPEGPLFFVGEGLSLAEMKKILTAARITERSG
jgi:hypothetical protein